VKTTLKPLVRPEGAGPEILFAFVIAQEVYRELGASEFTVTSVTDGRHSHGSKHHCGKAIDIRTRILDDDQKKKAQKDIQERLGGAYKVLLEKTHLHIQYSGV